MARKSRGTRNMGISGNVERWQRETPPALKDAIFAGWDGYATQEQKDLLTEWLLAKIEQRPIREEVLAAAESSVNYRRVSNIAKQWAEAELRRSA